MNTKREGLKLVTLVMLGGALVAGCQTEHHPVLVTRSGQVVVPDQPPSERTEMAGPAPGASYVWTPGYWSYSNARWVWIPGHWEAPPRSGVAWARGHWDHTSRGWVWSPGRWE